MKVTVNNEIGWEKVSLYNQNTKEFAAPGLPDGEHECELVWQYQHPWHKCKDSLRWTDIKEDELQWFKSVKKYPTRQIYRLSTLKEQGERSGVKTAEEIVKSKLGKFYSQSARLDVPTVIEAMQEYATQVAEAVRRRCIEVAHENQRTGPSFNADPFYNINISDFIK